MYENILISRRGVNVSGISTNVQELSDNEDNSITIIINEMSTIQMVSNTNLQSVNMGINTMQQEMVTLKVEVHAIRQVIANNATWIQLPVALVA